jgi:hypothetical protein
LSPEKSQSSHISLVLDYRSQVLVLQFLQVLVLQFLQFLQDLHDLGYDFVSFLSDLCEFFKLLYLVCVLFITSSVYLCDFSNYIMFMNKLTIYAITMVWSALCIFLVFCLFIRRVRVAGRARIVFIYASEVLGCMNSSRYVLFLPDLVGRW